MSIQSSTNDRKEFRCLILHLKKLYPSWEVKEITKFVMQSENPPCYTTPRTSWLKISRILKRNQVDDLPRSRTPRSTTTIEYTQAVRENIRLKKNALAEKARQQFGNLRNLIFQDDQDKKQRTRVALEAVENVFPCRIEPFDCYAKLADIWPIERVWGVLKEKLRGREYIVFDALKKDIKKEWKNIDVTLCQQMIDEIPNRLN